MAKELMSRRAILNARVTKPEELDDTPVEVPAYVQQGRPDDLRDMIQRMVRNEVSRAAVDHGAGSFEEEDDFSLDDDDQVPPSPYEVQMGEPTGADVPRETLDGEPQPDAPSLPADPASQEQLPNGDGAAPPDKPAEG